MKKNISHPCRRVISQFEPIKDCLFPSGRSVAWAVSFNFQPLKIVYFQGARQQPGHSSQFEPIKMVYLLVECDSLGSQFEPLKIVYF